MRERLAIFDFDGTIIDGQSGLQIVLFLMRRKMLPLLTVIMVAWWGIRYKLKLPHEQSEVRERIFRIFKGEHVSEVADLMSQFHDEMIVPLYRPQALAEIERCRADGMHVIVVSASFNGIVEPAARRIGADAQISTLMERDEAGYYTGKMKGFAVEGPQKLILVHEFADAAYGAGNWELSRAYGDHHSDGTLLAAAKEPVAVDPDRGLGRRAREEGWRIVEWLDKA